MVSTPLVIPYTTLFLSLPLPVIEALITELLTKKVIENDTSFTKGIISRFHAKDKPALNLKAYLHRLIYYTPFPLDAILLSILYLNRITSLKIDSASITLPPVQLSPNSDSLASTSLLLPSPLFPYPSSPPTSHSSFPSLLPEAFIIPLLSSYTIHRLLLSTLLVSTKFSSDHFFPSALRTAKVAGVGVRELARLEGEVLGLLKWGLDWESSGGGNGGENEAEVEIVSRGLLELGVGQGIELIIEGFEKIKSHEEEVLKQKEAMNSESIEVRPTSTKHLFEIDLCPTPPLPPVRSDGGEAERILEVEQEEEEVTPPSSTVSLSPPSTDPVGVERKGTLSLTETHSETEVVGVVNSLDELTVVDE